MGNGNNDMMKQILVAVLLGGAVPAAASAQQSTITQTIAGTRLDISATGETTRVPDVAVISAGVVSRAVTASAALQETADRMARVRTALKRAGIADRDIQTSNVSLNPEYRYADNQPPQLTGYTASNQVTVRFRDIGNSGAVLDALVAQGANQINGPTLTIDRPEAALDEARANAVAIGRARAELYARSLGMRVARLVSVAESGGDVLPPQPPMPMMMARAEAAQTKIDPGEQKLQVSLAMTFELQ
ncbi:SIMPL domain-containing protein [Sphingomonas sp.]|uniref:SIMPL domain-containing protein n=1 Tax=Sphingomonas sp. TaxID=28214 RepID=UPI0025DD3657|nr:SIMPL domain-containing protein [Sphingomonas sp.]MBV9528225.1 SIMPL domain-containing protein [Sphingomonas sp.]